MDVLYLPLKVRVPTGGEAMEQRLREKENDNLLTVNEQRHILEMYQPYDKKLYDMSVVVLDANIALFNQKHVGLEVRGSTGGGKGPDSPFASVLRVFKDALHNLDMMCGDENVGNTFSGTRLSRSTFRDDVCPVYQLDNNDFVRYMRHHRTSSQRKRSAHNHVKLRDTIQQSNFDVFSSNYLFPLPEPSLSSLFT